MLYITFNKTTRMVEKFHRFIFEIHFSNIFKIHRKPRKRMFYKIQKSSLFFSLLLNTSINFDFLLFSSSKKSFNFHFLLHPSLFFYHLLSPSNLFEILLFFRIFCDEKFLLYFQEVFSFCHFTHQIF